MVIKNNSRLFLSLGFLAALTVAFVLFRTYSPDVPIAKVEYPTRELAKDFSLPVIGRSAYFASEEKISLQEARRVPVLLHFWASWCGICREEKPVLDAFWRKHKDQEILLLGVASFDTKKAMDESGLIKEPTFTVILDENGDTANAYKVSALPVSILIDEQGLIVEKFMGPLMPYDLVAIENYLQSRRKNL